MAVVLQPGSLRPSLQTVRAATDHGASMALLIVVCCCCHSASFGGGPNRRMFTMNWYAAHNQSEAHKVAAKLCNGCPRKAGSDEDHFIGRVHATACTHVFWGPLLTPAARCVAELARLRAAGLLRVVAAGAAAHHRWASRALGGVRGRDRRVTRRHDGVGLGIGCGVSAAAPFASSLRRSKRRCCPGSGLRSSRT